MSVIDRIGEKHLSEALTVIFDKTDQKENGCWEWNGDFSNGGYGRLYFYGKRYSAHRLSYMAFVGSIPQELCVLHKCDNRKCVNPKHLRIGTRSDNTKDMVAKRRGFVGDLNAMRKYPELVRHGEKHPMAILNEQQVLEIRKLLRKGIKGALLAKKFRVSETTISGIKLGKTWSYLPLPEAPKEGN